MDILFRHRQDRLATLLVVNLFSLPWLEQGYRLRLEYLPSFLLG